MLSSVSLAKNGNALVGSPDGTLYEVQRISGSFYQQVVWTVTTGGPIYSSPTVGPNGTIYVGSNDGKVFAIRPDGLVRWSYPTSGAVQSSPAVTAAGNVYVGSNDGNVYALGPNGSLDWKFNTTAPIFSSPAISPNGTVYIGSSSGSLYAIDSNGTLQWAFATNGSVSSSPAVAPDGTIYVGSQDGNLYAIWPNGSQRWSFHTNGSIFSSPAIDAAGTIYFGGDNHFVYAVASNGTIIWSFDAGGRVKASPIIGADQTLYVCTTEKHYACYSLGIPPLRFVESGLPAGQAWFLFFDGNHSFSRNATIVTHPLLGYYGWSTSTISCGLGCRYNGSSGSVDTRYQSTINIYFEKQFRIVLHVTPQGTGSTKPTQNKTYWMQANSTQPIHAFPYQLYKFSHWSSNATAISIAKLNASSTTAFIGATGVIVAHMTNIIGGGRHADALPGAESSAFPSPLRQLTSPTILPGLEGPTGPELGYPSGQSVAVRPDR